MQKTKIYITNYLPENYYTVSKTLDIQPDEYTSVLEFEVESENDSIYFEVVYGAVCFDTVKTFTFLPEAMDHAAEKVEKAHTEKGHAPETVVTSLQRLLDEFCS